MRGRGRFARMLAEVLSFHRSARAFLTDTDSSDCELTFGEFLRARGYSEYFIAHFAIPLVAAVWSCPPNAALGYPARYLFKFLSNHGLLTVTGSPQWKTVVGGSRTYVELIAAGLTSVRLNTPVGAVRRVEHGVEITFSQHPSSSRHQAFFDAAVIATHADEALKLLAKPSPLESMLLSQFKYSNNMAILHTDNSLLPERRAIRAAWNYQLTSCVSATENPNLSYYMTRLQKLPKSHNYIVTLNPGREIKPETVIASMDYQHPIYDAACLAAQHRLPELNDNVIAFAGAYHGWGFHEDGCRSGADAAAAIGRL